MKASKKILSFLAVGAVLAGGLGFILYAFASPVEPEITPVVTHVDSVQAPVHEAFGLNMDSFQLVRAAVKPRQSLGTILADYQVDPQKVAELAGASKGVFDLRSIRSGNDYTVFCSPDSSHKACYLVYQPDPINYVVFDLGDSVKITEGKRKVTLRQKEAAGVINSSLFEALDDAGADPALAMALANIYAWDIDFYSIQKGDRFKVIYTRQYVEDQPVGIGRITSAVFNHAGHDYYAFYYQNDSLEGYYDENAKSLRKAFLKAPLKFYHITSHYSLHRFHPIQHRWKAHLGTDYAAPTGTPIMSTAAGVVVASTYSRFNGNYVKVRHNSVYTTQYLHMSKRAVRTGQHVDQGQIIGYVGMTGLATGPHVCYRFWKNGKQVNPLNQKFPAANPVPPEDLADFHAMVQEQQMTLAGIPIAGSTVVSAQ